MASSSSSATPWKYDVFLSFRGLDTRTSFIDHLYAALRLRGIEVFKDDLELERGRPISDILAAIDESRFSLIVFSKNYASSSWCLDELVKIFDCCGKEGAGRQTAFPIFYGVDPSEVQEQTGIYGEAFLEHEKVFRDKIDSWRKAMTELANLSGWHPQNRGEVDFIREVVDHIHSKLRKSDLFSSIDARDYIGMDSHLEKLSPYLNTVEESNDVRFVGICGMGGVGKSTLAKFVYSKMSCQFDGSAFLENIRVVQGKEGGLADLQMQLLMQVLGIDKMHIWSVQEGVNEIEMRLSRKRVLVILDNVDHPDQLESLAGASHWFGSGSRIIITTRDERLLKSHRVNDIYKMRELGEDEALELFYWRAFGGDSPAEGYEELSRELIHYASRLPLALTILGSYIHGRPINEWKSALDKLKKFPNKEILENLRMSFDSLDENGQKIFLDIACFFVGEDVNFLIRVLESCEFYPVIGISDLIDKSLITISGSKIGMHDLVQQLGQEIVKEEHKEPGCRSRIWQYEDVWHILLNGTGSEQVEGIMLNVDSQEVHKSMSSKSFLKMKNLKLLRISNLHCLQGQEYLSNELRYLRGNGYPFETLPSSFRPDKLVELHLSYSNIKQLWKRKQRPLQMLKVINLSHSQNLIKTPDFSEIPDLEELILEGCTRLHEVHQSIGVLERLVLLNLKDCKSLQELPGAICDLKSLKNLILHGCSELRKLPERLGDLTCLEVLDLSRDAANEQPPTSPWDFLSRPWLLLPWKDPSPVALTLPSLSNLRFLRDLNLSYCKLRDGVLPNDLGFFPLLESLDLSGNDFKSLPTSIGQLSKVHTILFNDCKRLQLLPNLPSTVEDLGCRGCKSLETIPGSICGLSKLCWVDLRYCSSVKSLPDLPTSIQHLLVSGCASLETLPNNISGLSRLSSLFIDDCKSLRKLPDLSGSLSTDRLGLNFLNCLKLTEKQDVLKKYLHSILKNKRQGLPSPPRPELHVVMSSAGGGIPGWFNYVSEGASLKVELPPYWFNDECVGFSIFVLGFHDSAAKDFSFSFGVKGWITREYPISVDLYNGGWIFNVDTCYYWDTRYYSDTLYFSDLISLSFFPLDESKSADWWNSLSHLEVSLTTGFIDNLPSLKPKYIGLRIVYEKDVEELSGWSGTSSSPPFHNVVSMNKRSHDDDDGCSSDRQVESSIDSEGEIRPPSSKRLKLEGDEL